MYKLLTIIIKIIRIPYIVNNYYIMTLSFTYIYCRITMNLDVVLHHDERGNNNDNVYLLDHTYNDE